MDNSKDTTENRDEIDSLSEREDEQLTVEVPVELRAGRDYGCCKRLA